MELQDDLFGSSVAIAGDTIVVGAWWDDDNGEASGSAYVFTRTGTTWTEQAKLTASDGAAFERFGFSVAIAGDTIVVGAYLDDNVGSAYVFTRTGTIWTQQAKLLGSDGAPSNFGISVAIVGDTIVVGAREASYVFTRTGTTWIEQAKLAASDGAGSDQFGYSVTIAGNTVVVGAYWDDTDNGNDSGSVYIYDLN